MHIAYVPTINAAVTRKDKVTVQLIKVGGTGSGFPVKNPVLLGGRVRVRMTYTLDLAATVGEYPIGLHNFDLTVGPGNGESGRVQLITDNGCVPSTPNPFGLTQTFAYNRRLSSTGTRRVFETGPFRIAMFATTTSKQLNFKVRYMAECYNLNQQKCFNQTNYCTTLRNKRATDDGGNTTLSFYIQIAMPGEALMKQDIGSVNNIHAQECVADNTYWILAVVLGITLLIVTMVAMFVLCRLRTE
ncbi:uncharacterized protein LOC127862847 isoform X2 [Dreissena polymorpha]|uniref:Uncharacterized protein n=1 Tax=Dreissena polymorpha TaxID=45954 RepID=A0A9D3YC25_DREPO|nr:uncharacterized protein LOC127862847 isoform X2 [Dreissena polymorpha]KAH3696041.1 hypothetical protein DPMN_083503 [Dreissena polymorpha]